MFAYSHQCVVFVIKYLSTIAVCGLVIITAHSTGSPWYKVCNHAEWERDPPAGRQLPGTFTGNRQNWKLVINFAHSVLLPTIKGLWRVLKLKLKSRNVVNVWHARMHHGNHRISSTLLNCATSGMRYRPVIGGRARVAHALCTEHVSSTHVKMAAAAAFMWPFIGASTANRWWLRCDLLLYLTACRLRGTRNQSITN